MGKMKDLFTEQQEAAYEEYLESERNALREEGALEALKMVHYELQTKLKASRIFYPEHHTRPTAFREALEIVEKYLN
jgi:hypothetical protein